MKRYFITAIGTDSGKTLFSAIGCEALQADYWKPVQCGIPRDTDMVESLVSNPKSQFHKERYFLETPASPHAAAENENIRIQLQDFKLPITQNHLIVEGAGGLLVPLNQDDTMLDLIRTLELEVILVSNYYLGSINHSLLSVAVLKKYRIPVRGIIFNGERNEQSRQIILKQAKLDCLLDIPVLPVVDKAAIRRLAGQINLI